MSLLSFCVCKACSKGDRRKRQRNSFCTGLAKAVAKCYKFVMHNWLDSPGEQREEGCCHVRSVLYLIQPHIRGPRDNLYGESLQ